ncbi:MAG: hypothetical protein LC713_05535, partial [Actinobacteria bacterium]|nr:hypothetical protein [Actinomycetota bacterium]
MPRTGPRRSLTTAAALLAMLAAPSAAQAVTYTVKAGDGACGGAADTACGSLSDAATAAASGDVFNVSPGTYGSATFTTGGVTIAGTAAGVAVDGALTFSGAAGGVSKLEKVSVTQPTGSGPAITVSGASGLQISDAVVFGVSGDGVQFQEGTANKIVRSLVVTGGQEATGAVHVVPATADRALTMESTMVIGGLSGLWVQTGNGVNGGASGAVNVALRHVTSAGSQYGLALDASNANPLVGGPVGNITADVVDSIIQNGTFKKIYAGVPLLAPANTVTDTYTRTLMGAFDANAVFADPARRRYQLKAGSPAIGAGGFTAGESTTDINGDDRSAAPTDQGADEYVTPPPPATPPPSGPGGAGGAGDGTAPAVVITKPTARQRIRLSKKTTRTVTITRDGKKVEVRRTTTRKIPFRNIAGTAKDPSGIKAVVLTIEKLSSPTTTQATAAPTTKCRYYNPTKGLVLKSCAKPILLLAKLGTDGAWSYKVRRNLSAGTYRIVTAGLDGSGARGNSAPTKDAIHRFTLIK